jgi:hypothetical protein
MKNNAAKVVKFVRTHKIAIVAGAVAVTAIALQARHINQLNNFLDEKGLSIEYYGIEQ